MKYVEKAVLGLGMAVLLIVALYATIGNNDVFQYSNINDIEEFVAAVVVVAAAVVVVAAAAVVVAVVAVVVDAVGAVGAAVVVVVVGGAVVGVDISIVFAVCIFLIYLIMGLIEYFIIRNIEKKKIDKSYELTVICMALGFLIGAIKLPMVFENKAFHNMEYYESIVSYATEEVNGEVVIEVSCEKEGFLLARHLCFETLLNDSLVQNSIAPRVDSEKSVSENGTSSSYYRLVFERLPGTLYLFSYNKRKEVEIKQ